MGRGGERERGGGGDKNTEGPIPCWTEDLYTFSNKRRGEGEEGEGEGEEGEEGEGEHAAVTTLTNS